jgi:hypothetical protein
MNLAWCVLALALAGANDPVHGEADEAQKIWPLQIREAVEIGLRNSPTIRVTFAPRWRLPIEGFEPTPAEMDHRPVPEGATPSSIVVEPVDVHGNLSRIESEATALVQSVEREYWNLAAAHVQLWVAHRAVYCARYLFEFEEAVGNPESAEDLDEFNAIERRVRRFDKVLLDRSAELIAAERQLRARIGVPESDKRRIIPITAPSEAPLVFNWGSCVDGIPTNPPSLVRFRQVYASPGRSVIEEIEALDDANSGSTPCQDDDVSLVRWLLLRPPQMLGGCWDGVSSEPVPLILRVLFRREGHHSPPSFDYAVLAAGSCYHRYAKAEHRRAAAQEQMEAQRSLWNKGRSSAVSYLDAVEQYAILVTDECHRQIAYNDAVSAVRDIQGRLLHDYNVVVAEVHRGEVARTGGSFP